MEVPGFTNDDNHRIAFVIDCLFSEAIQLEELHKWAEHVIAELDEPPLYIFDLMDFDQALFHIYDVIGLYSCSAATSTEIENALEGLAYLRGVQPYESRLSKDQALKALKRNPHILEQYKKEFPFISLPALS